jgi:hypothetical protein
MSKKSGELVYLSVRVPERLRQRVKVAAVNARRSIQDVLTAWIEEGVGKMEQQQRRR